MEALYAKTKGYDPAQFTGGFDARQSLAKKCGKCGAVRVNDHQIGSEATVGEFYSTMVDVFRGLWRVLRDDGTVWMNMGTCFAGNRSFIGKPEGTDGVFARRNTRLEGVGSFPIDPDESLMLRDDLTPDQVRYVLSELAKAGKGREIR